jgi:nitroimidazol reductase NimA-like FMN-containing flavoprotein (pyridoxamine 5'-phosphate oxidase superfamily)
MEDLSRAEAFELLETLEVGHIGAVVDGEPYVTPISYVVIGEDVLFRSMEGRRARALRSHPRICIEASRSQPDGGWESVIAWGDAEQVDDPHRKADVVAALLAKYHDAYDGLLSPGSGRPFDPEPYVFAVRIDNISGRSSGRGFTPRTRPGRL